MSADEVAVSIVVSDHASASIDAVGRAAWGGAWDEGLVVAAAELAAWAGI